MSKISSLMDLEATRLAIIMQLKWRAFEAVIKEENPALFEKFRAAFEELKDNSENLKKLEEVRAEIEAHYDTMLQSSPSTGEQTAS